VRVLIDLGIIEDATKIWWDLRPSARFPTLESRICDVTPRLEHTLSLAALTQARCGCSGGSAARTSAGGPTTASSWARTAGARSATASARG
jgi:gamma-glutamyl:cysteine ligase YbdK (ATP-grasp superfamily)